METVPNPSLPPLDIELLKTVPRPDLVDALLDEAREAIRRQPGHLQQATESDVAAICWLPSEEDRIRSEARMAVADDLFGEISSEFFSERTGQELDSKEAYQEVKRKQVNNAIRRVGEHKERVEQHLKQCDSGVPQIASSLLNICSAQVAAKISLEGDYVRRTALEKLSEYPVARGKVLLYNAASGDVDSFSPACDALREAVGSHELSAEDAAAALRFTVHYLHTNNAKHVETQRGLLLDLLSIMREDMNIDQYPQTVATLAVVFRNYRADGG